MSDTCVLIPVYNHPEGIRNTVAKLQAFNLPCIVVDDGSNKTCRLTIDELEATCRWLTVLRHTNNQGKGAAVKSGLIKARQLGYRHAVQVDADEQHDLNALPALLLASSNCPSAVILGIPVQDASMPRLRHFSRYLTHFWVWVNTLSFAIPDAMCGFRIYPVAAVTTLIEDTYLGDFMEFDIEVLVKLHWRGIRFCCIPVRTVYPEDGISHFRLFKDNWLITKMHTRLFFGMLVRIPELWRRL